MKNSIREIINSVLLIIYTLICVHCQELNTISFISGSVVILLIVMQRYSTILFGIAKSFVIFYVSCTLLRKPSLTENERLAVLLLTLICFIGSILLDMFLPTRYQNPTEKLNNEKTQEAQEAQEAPEVNETQETQEIDTLVDDKNKNEH